MNYDGSEKMTICTYLDYVVGSYSHSNYYYNSNTIKAYVTVNISASWVETPFLQMKDQLGIIMGAGVGNLIHWCSNNTAVIFKSSMQK